MKEQWEYLELVDEYLGEPEEAVGRRVLDQISRGGWSVADRTLGEYDDPSSGERHFCWNYLLKRRKIP